MLIPNFRSRSGQAIVLVALMLVVVIGAIGLAIDGARMYYESISAERAAAAGALSGVVYMPNYFTPGSAVPAGSGRDATDRAVAEAKRNGYDTADPNVTVTVAQVNGFPQELSVTVTHHLSLSFMSVFGIRAATVSRTAIAGYLSPISIGQPGQQLGATVSELGAANNYYFIRSEGWSTDRQQGDPFTPNNCYEYGGSISPCSSDVHQFSGAADPVATGSPLNLPSPGGQNYLITIGPSGGYIWVYNAQFGPEFSATNPCENMAPKSNSGTGHGRTCSSGSSNYYMHENDSWPGGTNAANFSAMKYTIFQVPNLFDRSRDVPLTTLTAYPVDASNWDPGATTKPTYTEVYPTSGTTITQQYDCSPLPCAGNATNMWGYHHWLDPHTYTGPSDGGTMVLTTYNSVPALLPAGTYRLRVDTLNDDGTNPPGSSVAHKGYAVAVSATAPTASSSAPTTCAGCGIAAWYDMTIYTPVVSTSFSVPIFSLPASYAGQTVIVELYDLGDVGGSANATLSILDPTGAVATAPAGQKIPIFDLGRQRSNPTPSTATACTYTGSGSEFVTNAPCTVSNGTTASVVTYNGSYNAYNGHWLHFEIPISSTYNPAGSTYWSLQYTVGSGVSAGDTFAIRVALKGAPARLLSS